MKNILILLMAALMPISLSAAAPVQQVQMRTFTVTVQGAGRPVILIPGLACSAEVWTETAEHLNAKGFQTHAITIAGFGGTKPVQSEHLLSDVRDDIATYVQQSHLEHPVIVGHSLGGFLALWFAARNPELAGKVVSVDGLPFLVAVWNPNSTQDDARTLAGTIREKMLTAGLADYQAQARQTIESMVTSSANRERELKVDLSSDRATAAQAMSEMMSTDLRPEVAKISAPVLLLGSWIAYKSYGATHDGVLAAYDSQLKGARKVNIMLSDTSRHFIQLDAPEWFYRQLDEFLK